MQSLVSILREILSNSGSTDISVWDGMGVSDLIYL